MSGSKKESDSKKGSDGTPKKKSGATGVRDRRHPDDSSVLDPSSLDEDYEYRFVQERVTNVAQKKTKGYTFVEEGEVETLLEQEDKSGDGRIRHGDRVLMKCPKTRVKQRRERHRELNENRLNATSSAMRQKADQAGVRVIEGDSRSEPPDKED